MYKKILMPLDASPIDEAILDHITELAKVHKSRVILVRVTPPPTPAADSLREAGEKAQAYCEAAAARLKEAGLEVEVHAEEGTKPAHVILEHAEDLGCDLIAMSTHGHEGWQDLLYGSVADKVRHSADIPVLLLRGKR